VRRTPKIGHPKGKSLYVMNESLSMSKSGGIHVKKVTSIIVGLFLILTIVMPQPSSCGAQLTIDKGCGATYYPNEMILICYKVTASEGSAVTVTLKDRLADGTVNVMFANKSILPNIQYYATGVVAPPYGTETLILEWSVTSGVGSTGIETCSFTVASNGGSSGSFSGSSSGGGSETTLRIDSNVSGFQVWWNGVYNHTTPYNYALLCNVPSGTHTVTLKKSGCSDGSKTITIIPGVENQVTITMSCGSSSSGESSDIDEDGVPDDEDGCYNPDCNIVDSKGCPKDTDRDGLNDCDDDCQYDKGSSSNDGCPAEDRDNDGVTDDKDGCYNPECSIVDSRGCPEDSDSDGITDCEDDCPSEYGEQKNDGCPEEDADNDGVPDDEDNCYNPGCRLVDSRGCPWDSDNDGMNDCEDNCPNQSGPRSNYGCPSPTSSTLSFDLIDAVIKFFFAFLLLIVIIGAALLIWRRKQKKTPVSSRTRPYDDTRIY